MRVGVTERRQFNRKETSVRKRFGKYLPYTERKRPIPVFELTERATANGRGRATSFPGLFHWALRTRQGSEGTERGKGGWFDGGLVSNCLIPIFLISDITYRHRNSSHLAIDGVFNHLLAHGSRNLPSHWHYTFLCDTGAFDNDCCCINRQEKSRKNRKDFKVNQRQQYCETEQAICELRLASFPKRVLVFTFHMKMSFHSHANEN